MTPSRTGWALWLTGLPASGKSTIARALAGRLAARGVDAAVLESDEVRRILTPSPRYDDEERDTFYASLAWIGSLLVGHGVPVIFDATANRRRYRDEARRRIERFLEIHVDTPLATCAARDPKGIYRAATEGDSTTVPGLQAAYEPPERPDVVVHADREDAGDAARRLEALLDARGWLG